MASLRTELVYLYWYK